jgi:hypothetical protein
MSRPLFWKFSTWKSILIQIEKKTNHAIVVLSLEATPSGPWSWQKHVTSINLSFCHDPFSNKPLNKMDFECAQLTYIDTPMAASHIRGVPFKKNRPRSEKN